MSQDPVPSEAARRGDGRWVGLAALAGVLALVFLAALGQARLGPSLVAAVLVAALGGWLIQRARRSPPPGPGAPAIPAPPGPEDAIPFAAVLEQLADPILLVAGGRREDPGARRFIFANSAARELLRIQRPEGPLTTAIRSPEVLTAVDEALFGNRPGLALYESGGVQDRVWRARALPLTGVAELSEPGAGRLALVSLRDETEFRRSERTRADFLANASHELRTPLASLAGFIETLRGHARDDATARERFLAIMHIQAERMGRLIDDLMSLSRIELGEHIRPSTSVDVSLAAIDVLDALGPMAADKGVAFRQLLPGPGHAVGVGDRDQIVQVIQNLAENALKYTPPGAEVKVQVQADLSAAQCIAASADFAAQLPLLTPDHAAGERYVALKVRDAGPGIARNHLPRLTERFYRVEGQKSGEHTGTGLGLAIVKHIVNRHRGGLMVESAEGSGSMFTAYIPMAVPTGGGSVKG